MQGIILAKVKQGVSQLMSESARLFGPPKCGGDMHGLTRAHTLRAPPLCIHRALTMILQGDPVANILAFQSLDQTLIVALGPIVQGRKIRPFRLVLIEHVDGTEAVEDRLLRAGFPVHNLLENRGQNPEALIPGFSLDLSAERGPLGSPANLGKREAVHLGLIGHQQRIVVRVAPERFLDLQPAGKDRPLTGLIGLIRDERDQIIHDGEGAVGTSVGGVH